MVGGRVVTDMVRGRDGVVHDARQSAVAVGESLVVRSRPAAVQVLDVMVDAATGRWALVPGLTIFAATFALGATRLAGSGLRVEKTRTDEAVS